MSFTFTTTCSLVSIATCFPAFLFRGGESEKKGLANVISIHDIHGSIDQSNGTDKNLTSSNM